MARLIDADALMETIRAHDYLLRVPYSNGTDNGMFTNGIQQAVDEQPTVDAVPIVRCGECKHRPTIPDDYNPIATDGYVLDFPDEKCPCQAGDCWYSKYLGDDWFCANGERKEEGEDGRA